ncbi:MAG: response regulator [Ignavibacteria bacterium]|nr:response regulator [Ignavibacteria bacterium]
MKKMLIVEDDELSIKFLNRIFSDKFGITIIESAEEFYSKYSETEFDIIIMDISIKGSKHGLTLTSEMKAMPKFSNVPILCLTAHAYKKDRTQALAAGADFYLSKPVSNKILKETVANLLAK